MINSATLLLQRITKSFGGNKALEDVTIEVLPGRTHCLLGDNGAGKSTLIKIMSGVVRPDAGTISIGGRPISLGNPGDARALGIATVYQDADTLPLMSAGRNFFLGTEPTVGWGPFRRFNRKVANSVALEQIKAMGITRVASGGQLVGTMSGGERQALSIARAMHFGASVLVLDEPTSALGVKEAALVLKLVQRATAEGIAVVFITHNGHHALTVGDDFTVLIQGRVAAHFQRGERTPTELLTLMAGGDELTDLQTSIEDEYRHFSEADQPTRGD